jgi:hypothetical protein
MHFLGHHLSISWCAYCVLVANRVTLNTTAKQNENLRATMALLGAILVIPYMLVFFTCWLVASLSRPLMYCTVICLLLNPLAAKRKLTLFVNAFQYMFFCNDKKWKDLDPPKYSTVHKTETKTVIFVRHGKPYLLLYWEASR